MDGLAEMGRACEGGVRTRYHNRDRPEEEANDGEQGEEDAGIVPSWEGGEGRRGHAGVRGVATATATNVTVG